MGHNNNNNFGGGGGPPQGGQYDRFDEPGYNSGGIGAGGAPAHTNMAPRTDAHGNPERPSGGSKFAGKAEAALGGMVGSTSLKQRGMEKQQ